MASSTPQTDVAPPEVHLARRVLQRFELRPPVDVEGILRQYADLEFDNVPYGIDAVCIGLKTPGRRPTVIVKRSNNQARVRFTLAHELGHVVIPWHSGSLLDDIHLANFNEDEYFIEAEANRFASELLIPRCWLDGYEILNDPLRAIRNISEDAKVSFQAALIKVASDGPTGLVYAEVRDGVVANTSRTPGTLASAPSWGKPLEARGLFPIAKHFHVSRGGSDHHWWAFPQGCEPLDLSSDEWKPILAAILGDLGFDGPDYLKFRQSLNGVLSGANSSTRHDRTPERIHSNILQRLYSAAMYSKEIRMVIDHPSFNQFLRARVAAFVK